MTDQGQLTRLAKVHGIQPQFTDNDGVLQQASPDTLRAALHAMGVDPDGARRRSPSQGPSIEPVVVAWDGAGTVPIRGGKPGARVDLSIRAEDGSEIQHRAHLEQASRDRPATVDLPLLEPGYYNLDVEVDGARLESTVIAAPTRAHEPQERRWGVFAPVYALRSAGNAGAGDLVDLAGFAGAVRWIGGSFVGTLPILASFLDDPFEPSPYVPVSRVLWNEFFTRPPGIDAHGAEFLRTTSLVDYRQVAALKREAIAAEAESAYSTPRWAPVAEYATCRPLVERYARFRAYQAAVRKSWQQWPAAPRAGRIADGEFDVAEYRYHLYAQWLANSQVEDTAAAARGHGVDLYLDFPIGVHPDGFDTWDNQGQFASGVSVGAPPDAFYNGGQDWGFPPLLPGGLRQVGYRPLIEALRHHMRVAGMLRIDHVMGFHRMYWVPHGAAATEGVYVTYPAEELYAVVCLESARHGVTVVGEDLGTVPPAVRKEMARHGVRRMYVVQTELRPGRERALPPPPPQSIASLNTHDMPPFAAYWQRATATAGDALRQELNRGGLCERDATDPADLALAANRWLARTPAESVMVNVEDAWAETQPQNTPGTTTEVPNWRGKLRYTLEELPARPEFAALATLSKAREVRT